MDIRLSICVPTGGTVKTDTVQCLLSSIVTLKCAKHISFLTGGYSYHNRNIGIKQAQDAGMTHIFFLDADMIFEPDYIQRLIDHNLDIVGANYSEKKLPLSSTIKINGEHVLMIDHPDKPFKVDGLGSGFMLVKMSVFNKLKPPYFYAPMGEDINDFTTEDYYFCQQAKKAGFDAWCDPSLKVRHMGDYLY